MGVRNTDDTSKPEAGTATSFQVTRHLLAVTDDAVAWSEDGVHLTLVSAALAAIFALPSSALEGTRIADLLPPERRGSFAETLAFWMRNQPHRTYPLELHPDGGQAAWAVLEAVFVPELPPASGFFIRLLGSNPVERTRAATARTPDVAFLHYIPDDIAPTLTNIAPIGGWLQHLPDGQVLFDAELVATSPAHPSIDALIASMRDLGAGLPHEDGIHLLKTLRAASQAETNFQVIVRDHTDSAGVIYRLVVGRSFRTDSERGAPEWLGGQIWDITTTVKEQQLVDIIAATTPHPDTLPEAARRLVNALVTQAHADYAAWALIENGTPIWRESAGRSQWLACEVAAAAERAIASKTIELFPSDRNADEAPIGSVTPIMHAGEPVALLTAWSRSGLPSSPLALAIASHLRHWLELLPLHLDTPDTPH